MPSCSHPIAIPASRTTSGRSFLAPCSKCAECLSRKRQGWILRAQYEMQGDFKYSYFITLSFDDEHLTYESYSQVKKGVPVNPVSTGEPVLCPYELRKFFERFRIFSGERFSYFACGEYGDEANTHRPHFHICLWCNMNWQDTLFYVRLAWSRLRPETRSERYQRLKLAKSLGHPIKRSSFDMRNRISYGRDQVRCLSYKRISYVSKYVTKQVGSNEVVPTFYRASKKLGSSFFKTEVCRLLSERNVHFTYLQSGVPCSLPRYYSRYMFNTEQMEQFYLDLIYKDFPFDDDTPKECITGFIKHKRLVESAQRRRRLLSFQGVRFL